MNIGDKVRVKRTDDEDVGKTGIVIDITKRDFPIHVKMDATGCIYLFKKSELEVIK